MTLDEAITYAEEVYKDMSDKVKFLKDPQNSIYDMGRGDDCLECAEQHRQLAEWLKELKTLRNYIVTELEISCSSSNDTFDEDDERYYLLDKLNSMIAIESRYPNNLQENK